jgi:carbon-monoxide dehydrogenase large subunit
MMASGTAIFEAATKVIERGRKIAAHLLEASDQDVEFARGRFAIPGTDRSIGLLDLVRRIAAGGLPEDCPNSLDVNHIQEASRPAFPNGCHVAEVEIDPQTGVVTVVRYTMEMIPGP